MTWSYSRRARKRLLTKRLLIPALYNLEVAGRAAGKGFRILGVDHGACDARRLADDLGAFLRGLAADPNSEFGKAKIDGMAWRRLAARLDYLRGDFEDPAMFAHIAEVLGAQTSALFYMATAPRFFGEIVDQLGRSGLAREPAGGFRRVVIEKPFGDDLNSARALNRRILETSGEPQIFRIDRHFLGKETVRNIMATRFCKRRVRAAVEPAAHRLGGDHRGGNGRRRGARGLL